MQTPEKLSLIGGSILLASTLVFTLKTSASDILPKVSSGVSSLTKSNQERQQDQQKQQQVQEGQAFNNNFQQAQQKGWQTGQWGTAKFYVDDQGTMHVGSGQLIGSFSKVINASNITNINFDNIAQAPQNSTDLFTTISGMDNALTHINGLNSLDTSHVTNMNEMFAHDASLSSLDLSHFDTSQVTNMSSMFVGDSSLSNLDVSNWDTSHVTNMNEMFDGDNDLNNLNLSSFDTSNVTDMTEMFSWDNNLTNLNLSNFNTKNVTSTVDMFTSDFQQLTLGPNSLFSDSTALSGNYQNNNQMSKLTDNKSHPGTWTHTNLVG